MFLIANNSKLPTSSSCKTDKRSSTITVLAKDIGEIIRSLNPNKAHSHNNLSICMLKLCGDAFIDDI